MTFGVLQRRLIRFVSNRISNGDFSERGLARVLRVSQPQIHKVLKGQRKLTPELADRLLMCFGMTVLDLLNVSEVATRFRVVDVHTPELGGPQANVLAHIPGERLPAESGISRKTANRQSTLHPSSSTKTV